MRHEKTSFFAKIFLFADSGSNLIPNFDSHVPRQCSPERPDSLPLRGAFTAMSLSSPGGGQGSGRRFLGDSAPYSAAAAGGNGATSPSYAYPSHVGMAPLTTSSSSGGGYDEDDDVLYPLALYVCELEEIRLSPVVSKKGFVNIMEEKKGGWTRRYLVRLFILHLILHCFHHSFFSSHA
jgi:hypothetical protein